MTRALVGKNIEEKLKRAFNPIHLEVIDESSRHLGHAGSRPQGETHFDVKIVAEAFTGKSRVEQHRLINAVLEQELQSTVHALAIHASAPEKEI